MTMTKTLTQTPNIQQTINILKDLKMVEATTTPKIHNGGCTISIELLKQLEKLEETINSFARRCEEVTIETEQVYREIELQEQNKGVKKPVAKKEPLLVANTDLHTQKLFHFIITSLEKTAFNSILSYTDKTSKNEFKIHNPTKLAALWGREKGKTNLTERKLNRGLSYLIKQKNQLKKVGKWKYEILDKRDRVQEQSSFENDLLSPNDSCSSSNYPSPDANPDKNLALPDLEDDLQVDSDYNEYLTDDQSEDSLNAFSPGSLASFTPSLDSKDLIERDSKMENSRAFSHAFLTDDDSDLTDSLNSSLNGSSNNINAITEEEFLKAVQQANSNLKLIQSSQSYEFNNTSNLSPIATKTNMPHEVSAKGNSHKKEISKTFYSLENLRTKLPNVLNTTNGPPTTSNIFQSNNSSQLTMISEFDLNKKEPRKSLDNVLDVLTNLDNKIQQNAVSNHEVFVTEDSHFMPTPFTYPAVDSSTTASSDLITTAQALSVDNSSNKGYARTSLIDITSSYQNLINCSNSPNNSMNGSFISTSTQMNAISRRLEENSSLQAGPTNSLPLAVTEASTNYVFSNNSANSIPFSMDTEIQGQKQCFQQQQQQQQQQTMLNPISNSNVDFVVENQLPIGSVSELALPESNISLDDSQYCVVNNMINTDLFPEITENNEQSLMELDFTESYNYDANLLLNNDVFNNF